MKFKKYFTIVLLFMVASGAWSQTYNYIIEYDYYHQTDSNNKNSVHTESMLLLYNNQGSHFVSKSKFKLDSVKNIYGDDLQKMMDFISTIPKNRVKFEILKHLDQSKSSNYYETIFPNTYKNEFKYDLIASDTIIAGYACKKARVKFSGRNYTIWYTNKIAISDGPYKFFGLPGLVLEVYDDKYHHHFKITKIENRKLNHAPTYNNIIKASMKEIAEARKNQLANLNNLLGGM